MNTKRGFPLLLAAVAGLSFPSPSALCLEAAVDLKNDSAMSVSVPLGTDNGLTRNSDFRVMADNDAVTIYPVDLYDKRFWSQPLSEEAYARIHVGTPVRSERLDGKAHVEVRTEGGRRGAEMRARQEEARRLVTRQKIEDLRDKKEKLLGRRDDLEERIAAAEKQLADEEGRADWLMSSEDDSIDRSLQRIMDLGDRRDELQAQRDALARQLPAPRGEAARITSEIRRLNDQIASERDTIRISRERKRTARSAYLSRRQEWQKLVSDRNAVVNEIRSVDQKIGELSGKR